MSVHRTVYRPDSPGPPHLSLTQGRRTTWRQLTEWPLGTFTPPLHPVLARRDLTCPDPDHDPVLS